MLDIGHVVVFILGIPIAYGLFEQFDCQGLVAFLACVEGKVFGQVRVMADDLEERGRGGSLAIPFLNVHLLAIETI